MDEGIKVGPYKGIMVKCIILIIVPLLLYLLFGYLIFVFQSKFSKELNHATVLTLSFGVGFLYQMTCVFVGLFKGSLKVVIRRVVDFFANLSISFKFARKMYWDDIVENGVVFWIAFPIIITTLSLALYGLFELLSLY